MAQEPVESGPSVNRGSRLHRHSRVSPAGSRSRRTESSPGRASSGGCRIVWRREQRRGSLSPSAGGSGGLSGPAVLLVAARAVFVAVEPPSSPGRKEVGALRRRSRRNPSNSAERIRTEPRAPGRSGRGDLTGGGVGENGRLSKD